MIKPKIKLVLADIDGTFVEAREKALPTKKVIEATKLLEKRGVIFCFATGRSLLFVENILNLIPLKSFLILNGGSEIYDLKIKKYVWKKNLKRNQAKKIISYLDRKGYHYRFYDNYRLCMDIKKASSWLIPKIAAVDLNPQEISKLKNQFSVIPNIHMTIVDSWSDDKTLANLHITHIEATKQHAVFELLKILKINRENVLGIGDRENDIPLLSACGVKIAMGNADQRLKEIADWVTPPVWEDGFAAAMEKFVL